MPAIVPSEPKGTLREKSFKATSELLNKLTAYAKYANAPTDKVIRVALERLFADDADFMPWFTENHHAIAPKKREPRAKKTQAPAQS
jgi:hypothetical protein